MKNSLIIVVSITMILALLTPIFAPAFAAPQSNRLCYAKVTPGTQWKLPNRNGTEWFYLDVTGTKKADGYFIYWNKTARHWDEIRFSPWGDVNGKLRFGVSTWFATGNVWWKQTNWYYAYNC